AAQADGLAHAHRELVGHLRGRGEAVESAALARRVVGAVNRLLHVAAGLLQDLAHLARHLAREPVLVAYENLTEAEEYLGATRRGQASPAVGRIARRCDCALYVLGVGRGEAAYTVARVGGVRVLEPLARPGSDPLAAYVV